MLNGGRIARFLTALVLACSALPGSMHAARAGDGAADRAEQRAEAAEERARAAEARARKAEEQLRRLQSRSNDAAQRAADRETSRRLDAIITDQLLRDAGRR